jgi:hypothetical protein
MMSLADDVYCVYIFTITRVADFPERSRIYLPVTNYL